ncbi:MAG: radical SAM protein [Candidatus Electrothrix sp. GM3_4]|nr:radical SAM protein [Candidatus Electrothrix sp. GM3_4]
MNKDYNLQYLLINTPLTDPTGPYHSISYLVGAAVKAGYIGFSCVDANIEIFNFMTKEENVVKLICKSHKVRNNIEAKKQLTREDELTYRYALKGVGLTAKAVKRAIEIFQDSTSFYDYRLYRQAVIIVLRWLDLLSIDGFPGQFGGAFNLDQFIDSLLNTTDLTNSHFISKIVRPFQPYFMGPFKQVLHEKDWQVVGLSVNFISQLPFAVRMCEQIRAECPTAFICLGGTEITDIVNYLSNKKRLWDIFPFADAIVIGEGETAFIDILNSVQNQEKLSKHLPCIILKEEPITHITVSNIRSEDLKQLAKPKYDIWNYTQYWSPEPVVLYSPTRGCYWSKCTFCDYGLNTDNPTSLSRERPIKLAIEELSEIRKVARTLYFSVDAISPSYLRKICSAINKAELNFQWSAEIRFEKKLAEGLSQELRQGGCVALSFGYESGSQRVLNLINKGVDINTVPTMLKELNHARIGVQMMGFVGFPGETTDEAKATFDFLLKHKKYWTIAGIGDFVLNPGSIVAKRYHDFGIQSVSADVGQDINIGLNWVDEKGQERGFGDEREDSINDLAKQISKFTFTRPFVGGNDSNHSILYFGKFGVQLIPPESMETYNDIEKLIETTAYDTPFQHVDDFISNIDVTQFRNECKYKNSNMNYSKVFEWLSKVAKRDDYPSDNSHAVLEIFPKGEFVITQNDVNVSSCEKSSAYLEVRDILLQGIGIV